MVFFCSYLGRNFGDIYRFVELFISCESNIRVVGFFGYYLFVFYGFLI